MGDPFQKLHSIAARRRDVMREIAHHQRPTPALEHSHYKWAYMGFTRSPLPRNSGNLPLPFFGGNYPIVLLDNIY